MTLSTGIDNKTLSQKRLEQIRKGLKETGR